MYDNIMNEVKSISDQLRTRRKALGLSLADVARRVGTSPATLSRYENGWSRFGTYTLQKLARALDCDLQILLIEKKNSRVPYRPDKKGGVQQFQRLFWEHDLSESDFDDHPQWVVERVLEYGNLDDVHLLCKILGRGVFLDTVSQSTRLSGVTQNFWQQILAMEGVKCTKKYSRNTAWNS
jgi:transcriptional regulator with XRE-family HTH domain